MKKTDKKLIKQWRKWAKKNPDRVDDTMKAFAAIANKIEDKRWAVVMPVMPRPLLPEDFAMPDAPPEVNLHFPTDAPVTAVKKRSTHPDPRGFVFRILDRLHAQGIEITGRPVIDRAVANGITENTARSLVHLWRKQNGLSKTLNKKGAN